MRTIAALAAAALLCACASTGADRAQPAPIAPRQAWIVAGDGRPVGQATFTEAPGGVMIRLEFSDRGLPPGWHGLHLHQHGDCSDFAAGFHAAAGHIGMSRTVQHGLMNPHGPEAGDLPNLFVSPAGPYAAEFFTPYVTLSPTPIRGREQLLDEDGSALVIHAQADDQVSQPIGNAGPRIACAALTRLP